VLIPDSYRAIEKARGRSLQEIHSSGVAFTRADMLEALTLLKGSHACVLGIDVLKITEGRLRYAYASYNLVKRPGEDVWKYLARSIAEAEAYVRKYPEPEDGTILYSPVISELGT
jgi:hypothetical protein